MHSGFVFIRKNIGIIVICLFQISQGIKEYYRPDNIESLTAIYFTMAGLLFVLLVMIYFKHYSNRTNI